MLQRSLGGSTAADGEIQVEDVEEDISHGTCVTYTEEEDTCPMPFEKTIQLKETNTKAEQDSSMVNGTARSDGETAGL